MQEFVIAGLGVIGGLALDVFRKAFELELVRRKESSNYNGEISSGIARMIHAVLWVTYRVES